MSATNHNCPAVPVVMLTKSIKAKVVVAPHTGFEAASSASLLKLTTVRQLGLAALRRNVLSIHHRDHVVHLRLAATSGFKAYVLGAAADLLLILCFCCERVHLGTSET
jgi:hypothetical protein